MSDASVSPRLSMRGIAKRFGGNHALAGVDLDVAAGEVHALIGENGAGKSTLMKVLAGAIESDGGTMHLDGVPYAPTGPLSALDAGVAMIYQELNLAPDLSIEDNLRLGRETRVWLRRGAERSAIRDVLRSLGRDDLDPRTEVGSLGPGDRQLVEVARALLYDARVVVMDEPTSSLSGEDTRRLFEMVKALTQRGVSVIYISHFLDEIARIGDEFTVLRDGKSVAHGRVADHSASEIVTWMVGRSVDELFPRVPHEVGEPILTLDGVGGVHLPEEATLTLHRGEILGIAGLVGAGRTELLRSIFGLDPVRRGTVRVASGSGPATPRGRWSAGLGMVSEDRKTEGLALGLDIADNLTLSALEPYVRGGWLRRGLRQRAVADWIERLGVRCEGPSQTVGHLSGGNQQKVALGRLLHHDVDVLLLDEPTRGVDVGSKSTIYQWMGELAARGRAVLFVSSYLPELLGVSDRIAVMHRGRLGSARPVDAWDERSLMAEAVGGAESPREMHA